MKPEHYEKLLDSCTENCPNSYCFLKMFFLKQHPNERVVVQIKCIEIAKWTWSAEAGEDIGWKATGDRWVNDGYAEEFAVVFSSMSEVELYDKEVILLMFKSTVERVKQRIKTEDVQF